MIKFLSLIFGSVLVSAIYLVKELETGDVERDQYDELFIKYGRKYGVPPLWLKTIAKIESDIGQHPKVKNNQLSYDGLSKGIMQIVPNNGSAMERKLKGNPTEAQWNDPEWSIETGARLLGYLFKKYNGDEYKTIIAYNQGEKNTDSGEDFTSNYHGKFVKFRNQIRLARRA